MYKSRVNNYPMPKYPIGLQDFLCLRNDGYIYVDKTRYICELIENGKYYFLGRPRRFGKSLFLSTMEYFFRGRRELFKGLYIDTYPWDWKEYPVIHLDLNGSNYPDSESLNERLSNFLSEYEQSFSLAEDKAGSLSERLRNLIIKAYEKRGLPVVVLVDEYEKPVIDNIDNPDIMEKHRQSLQGFYSVLKSLDKYLKLVFLTGVTKFGQLNVFSGLNNIRDISLNPKFGAICGITFEELTEYFKEGINDLAKDRACGFEEVLSLLKTKYDGYHFSRNCPDIYNPFSIINALADLSVRPYWSYTGTPSILAKVLKQQNFNIESLEGIRVDESRLMGIHNQINDPVALFYQTGYLTIKEFNQESELYTLGYPNYEVEQAFFNYLLPNFSGMNIIKTDSFMQDLSMAFETGDAKKAMETLEEFSAGISYDVIPKTESERHFQYLLYIICKLLLSRKNFVKVEEKTSDGRIDLLISTSRYVYIIEIKKDNNSQKALEQIMEKEYHLQYRGDSRKVFLIGMNFSSEKRRLDGFTIST